MHPTSMHITQRQLLIIKHAISGWVGSQANVEVTAVVQGWVLTQQILHRLHVIVRRVTVAIPGKIDMLPP